MAVLEGHLAGIVGNSVAFGQYYAVTAVEEWHKSDWQSSLIACCWYWVFVHLLLCYVMLFQWLLQLFPSRLIKCLWLLCYTVFPCLLCLYSWNIHAQSLFSSISDNRHKCSFVDYLIRCPFHSLGHNLPCSLYVCIHDPCSFHIHFQFTSHCLT